MARSGSLPMPIKWFSIPQCWRYERTQRGRGREHYQWNVDIWGTTEISADAELISVLVTFFEEIGLTSGDIVIRISSRKVLEEVLGSLGVEGDSFAQTCIIVDKMDKLSSEVIEKQLSELGHSSEVVSKIQSVLGIKDIESLKKSLGDKSTAVSELNELFETPLDSITDNNKFYDNDNTINDNIDNTLNIIYQDNNITDSISYYDSDSDS